MMLELIFSLLLIVFCVVSGINLLLSSSDMMSYDPMGAAAWPLILCALLILLLSANVIKILKEQKGADAVLKMNGHIGQLLTGKFTIGIVVMFLYGIFLEKIGFLFSTPIFIFTYMTVLGQKKVSVKVVTALIATCVLYLLFDVLLQVPLPRGYGLFRDVALLVESML